MKNIMKALIILLGIIVAVVSCNSCKPIKNFTDSRMPKQQEFYRSPFNFSVDHQTAVILADADGTEIFDLLAPYSILNFLDSLNVVILSEIKSSVPLWKGLSIYAHFTLDEFQKINVQPDLVVVPNMLNPTNYKLQSWLRTLSPETTILSVCEGSRVIAETGKFSGHRIATHHSSLKQQRKRYPEMKWTEGFRYIVSDNLFSTSGVAAAVEGAMAAAFQLDLDDASSIQEAIQYPHNEIKRTMEPRSMGLSDMANIISKTGFKSNKQLAVYIPEHFNEYRVGAIIDTYNRTFPKSLHTFSDQSAPVSSKNLLLAVPTAKIDTLDNLDEIIVPMPAQALTPTQLYRLKKWSDFFECELVFYDNSSYLFHQLFERITQQYGRKYARTVFRLLDYDVTSEL